LLLVAIVKVDVNAEAWDIFKMEEVECGATVKRESFVCVLGGVDFLEDIVDSIDFFYKSWVKS
jgi:hypothetical protein